MDVVLAAGEEASQVTIVGKSLGVSFGAADVEIVNKLIEVEAGKAGGKVSAYDFFLLLGIFSTIF